MQIATLAANAAVPGLGAISAIGSPVSLDDMVKQALTQWDTTAQSGLQGIKNDAADVQSLTTPEVQLDLQRRVQNYSLYVSVTSTLARKGVSTIETLVKGQ
ncbi:hypothetical protein WJ69_34190 [Burkholderia ubonensis]|uniref:type III secretion system inner rod subunit SctI n=1 Tax=Burkholderia ubonensis TaxID=101571 RepID=UPI00075AAFD7|nr:type III secretion system inner rod subunit SctI [Burkholderia ubonensis]KVN98509.1 hypothetical protein WJ69_34190 [Burkholderia ubonensis]